MDTINSKKKYLKYKKKYLVLKAQMAGKKYTIDENLIKKGYVFKHKFPKKEVKMTRQIGRQGAKEPQKKHDKEYSFVPPTEIEKLMLRIMMAVSRFDHINENVLPKKSDLLTKIANQPNVAKFVLDSEILSGIYSEINEMNPDTGEIVITTPKGIYQLEAVAVAFKFEIKNEVVFEWRFKKAMTDKLKNQLLPRIIKKLEKLDNDILKHKELKELGLHHPSTIFPKDPANEIDIVMYMFIFKHFLDAKAYISLTSPEHPERELFLIVTDMQKKKDIPVKDIPLRTTTAREMVERI